MEVFDRRQHGVAYTPPVLVGECAGMVLAARPDATTFLDPACGDGNFLAWLAEHVPGAVLFGVEIDPDAAARARRRVPQATIVCGDALAMSWQELAGSRAVVVGNPPFVGNSWQTPLQRQQLLGLCGRMGHLDFAAAFVAKAAREQLPAGLVLPASMSRGTQARLWERVEIDFARRPQPWPGPEDVEVVVVGFGFGTPTKRLISGQQETRPAHINGFLLPFNSRLQPARRPGPTVCYGNQIVDGGRWLFTGQQRHDFLAAEPGAQFTPWVDGQTLLAARPADDGTVDMSGFRWLLLGGRTPGLPLVAERNEQVAQYRARSSSKATRQLAADRFASTFVPKQTYVGVPGVSSRRRIALPAVFLPAQVMPSNKVFAVPGGGLYEMGVMSSRLFWVWLKHVAGVLEDRVSFSITVYDAFPWPASSDGRQKVAGAMRQVLAARDPHRTLGDQYLDPSPALSAAHRLLDEAVAECYKLPVGLSDDQLIEALWMLSAGQPIEEWLAGVTNPPQPPAAQARRQVVWLPVAQGPAVRVVAVRVWAGVARGPPPRRSRLSGLTVGRDVCGCSRRARVVA